MQHTAWQREYIRIPIRDTSGQNLISELFVQPVFYQNIGVIYPASSLCPPPVLKDDLDAGEPLLYFAQAILHVRPCRFEILSSLEESNHFERTAVTQYAVKALDRLLVV